MSCSFEIGRGMLATVDPMVKGEWCRGDGEPAKGDICWRAVCGVFLELAVPIPIEAS